MIKHPFARQKRQKILNYQIKMIQECSDTLFNEDCSHNDRYLGWQLGQSLKNILEDYHYKFRWIGNDSNAYIYAYIYVLIVSCACQPSFMIQLKTVLYDLGRKYLAQYEQKLLIQFLCLIEYSQDRFMFFRKYARIQEILLKVFKQIQMRNPLKITYPIRPFKEQENPFSKLTTCITSPIKSKAGDYQNIKILRNSDYYNSSMKRIEQQFHANMMAKQKKLSDFNKHNFKKWYQLFNGFFKFVTMNVISQQNVKLGVQVQKKIKRRQEYIVTVQKECFFVVEMIANQNSGRIHNREISNISNSQPAIDESQMYLNKLLERQIKQSKIKNNFIDFSHKRNKMDSNLFTPKFISNKKKLSLVDNDLYKDDDGKVKNVQVQVLDVSQFSQHKNDQFIDNQPLEKGTISYKKKYNNLQSIGQTINSIHQQKYSIVQQIRSNPLFHQFKNKNPTIKTEKQINCYPRNHEFDEHRLQCSSHQNIPNCYKFQNQRKRFKNFKVQLPLKNPICQNNTIQKLFTFQANADVNKTTGNINPEITYINGNKVHQIPQNETVLSAANLKKRYSNGYVFRKNTLFAKRKEVTPRQFHSHSPQNHLLEGRPISSKFNTFYSPMRPTVGDYIPFGNANAPKKIKFTYL